MKEEVITLRVFVRRLAERWLLMSGIFVAVVMGVGLWSMATVPRYEGKAVLRIMDPPGESSLARRMAALPGGGVLGLGRDELETEIGILRSRRLAEAVVDSLFLMWELKKPPTLRRLVLDILQGGNPELEGRIELRSGEQGLYEISGKKRQGDRIFLGRVRAGDTVAWEGYRFRVVPSHPDSLPKGLRVTVLRRDQAVKKLIKGVRVRRQDGGSRLVEVSYLHPDRELAAAVVNSLVREYRRYKSEVELGEAGFKARELRVQAERYRQELAQAEEALRAFQEAHSLIAPEQQVEEEVRRFSEGRVRLDALEVEQRALREILSLVDGRVASSQRGKEAYRQLMAYPDLLSQQALAELLMSLVNLENEKSLLLLRRTEDNEDVQRIAARIAEVEDQIRRLGEDYLENLGAQAKEVQVTLQELESRLQKFPEVQVAFLRLQRNRQMLSEAYLTLDREARMAEVEKSLLLEGIRVVDSASVPHKDDPAYPKLWVQLLLGAGLGAVLAVLAALLRGFWEE